MIGSFVLGRIDTGYYADLVLLDEDFNGSLLVLVV